MEPWRLHGLHRQPLRAFLEGQSSSSVCHVLDHTPGGAGTGALGAHRAFPVVCRSNYRLRAPANGPARPQHPTRHRPTPTASLVPSPFLMPQTKQCWLSRGQVSRERDSGGVSANPRRTAPHRRASCLIASLTATPRARGTHRALGSLRFGFGGEATLPLTDY